jgi:MoaA/NifB/PqqE/SkfB family radical SAM enzyme
MHIETTTRCTLACPGCPRTVISDKLGSFPKQDLALEDLKFFLNCKTGHQLPKLCLEGNHGDPIYYPGLFELIDQFRDNKIYTVVTNGSYRDQKFWNELADRLTINDLVIFSIDGLEHNNHVYRRNSDWQSIMLGIDTLVNRGIPVGWKTLIFNYNYQEINQIQEFAESRGAKFVSETTSRFGDETLRPPEPMVETFREYSNEIKNIVKIEPQCGQHKKEYISADGYYWPCCWVSSAFTLYKSQLWKDRKLWRIKGQTLDIMRDQLAHWVDQLNQNPNSADVVCRMMCREGNPEFPNDHGLT